MSDDDARATRVGAARAVRCGDANGGASDAREGWTRGGTNDLEARGTGGGGTARARVRAGERLTE